MTSDASPIFERTPTYEWLCIETPRAYAVLEGEAIGFPATTVKLHRDDSYQLLVTAQGPGRVARSTGVAGTPVETSQLVLEYSIGQELVIEGYYSATGTTTHNFQDGESTILQGSAHAVIVRFSDRPVNRIVLWLCNLPDDILWPDKTERTRTESHTRERTGQALSESPHRNESFGRDHAQLTLNLPTLSAVWVGYIDSTGVPAATEVVSPGFVEFIAGSEGLPSTELQHTVLCALGHLFGGGLGVLGRTELDGDASVVRATLENPYAAGNGQGQKPYLLDERSSNSLDSRRVEAFLRSYIDHQESFNLNRVVWLLHHSAAATVDMASSYAGVAFEVLRSRFFKQPENRSESNLLDSDHWGALCEKLESTILDELTADTESHIREAYELVSSGLSGLNYVSNQALNLRLLDSLRLNFGKVEENALQSRNRSAHGAPIRPGEERIWVVRAAALQTLTCRVILALLGLNWNYRDYASVGFPLRRLRDAQDESRCP